MLLAALLALKEDPEICLTCSNSLQKPIWFFPSKEKFPFIYQKISKIINISESKNLFRYKLMSKFNFIAKKTTVSQNDFDHICEDIIGMKFFEKNLENALIFDEFLDDKMKESGLIKNKIVLVYTRDDSWYIDMKYSSDYIEKERFRNTDNNLLKDLVQNLINLDFGVIRVGRSSSSLFPSKIAGFLDYASQSDLVSDRRDFYLWNLCIYAVVTGGGAIFPGWMFGKPMIMWDFDEDPDRIAQSIPNYSKGKFLLIPRYSENNEYLSKRAVSPKFLEQSISLIMNHNVNKIYKDIEITNLKNILIGRPL